MRTDVKTGLVVRVHCRCENDIRCARCGALFGGRKLNANNFDPADRTVWHVPGFAALEHRCSSGAGGSAHHSPVWTVEKTKRS